MENVMFPFFPRPLKVFPITVEMVNVAGVKELVGFFLQNVNFVMEQVNVNFVTGLENVSFAMGEARSDAGFAMVEVIKCDEWNN